MYLGNQPALSYTSFAKQDFTTSATTSYTLDNPVANANELALFINFVRQEPTTAYTASGTSLTLTSATSASDDMYCVYLGKAVQTVNPPSGSVGTAQLADSSVSLAKLSATGTKDATTFLRGDNTFASAGGTNTPIFYGELASNTTIARASYVKVTGMTNDEVDSNSAFDGTTFTVPSGMNGTYYIYGAVQADYEAVGDDGEETRALIYKNGSEIKESKFHKDPSAGDTRVRVSTPQVSITVNLAVGDTIELYCMVIDDNNSGSGRILSNNTSLGGYKLIT
jgi:hypothetical protein